MFRTRRFHKKVRPRANKTTPLLQLQTNLKLLNPDFPDCPFGGAFSILGFDTAEQTYVWLVTSIIRDPRLIRIPYQGEDVITDE